MLLTQACLKTSYSIESHTSAETNCNPKICNMIETFNNKTKVNTNAKPKQHNNRIKIHQHTRSNSILRI